MKHSLILTILICLAGTTAIAQNEEKNDSTKSFIFSGNIDAYYRYAANKTASSTSPSYAQGLNLGWVNLSAEKNWKSISVKLDVAVGPRATQLYFNDFEPKFFSYIKQAYVAYSPTDKLKLTLGSITNPFNIEQIEPARNFVYTNTMIYTILPAAYRGLKAEYALTDHWSAVLAIFNDPRTKIAPDFKKHLFGGLVYVNDRFTMTTDFITGREVDTTNIFMAELYGDYAVTDKLKVGYQLHYMSDKSLETQVKSKWFGVALYSQYLLTQKLSLGLRGEWFNDIDGYGYGEANNKLFGFTLAAKYRIGKFFLLPEYRFDISQKDVYEHPVKGKVSTEPSFILAALLDF